MKSLLIGFLLLINSACAYHFGSVKRNIPGAYDRVAVPIFKNSTPEVGVEAYFTKSMIEEIERGHIASVVGKDDAQVVIEGQIVKIDYVPGATIVRDSKSFPSMPEDTALIKGYSIVATSRIQVRRKSDQKIIWVGDFLGEQPYPAPQITKANESSINPLYNHSSRHQNLEVMAKDMMAEAYSRMTENF